MEPQQQGIRFLFLGCEVQHVADRHHKERDQESTPNHEEGADYPAKGGLGVYVAIAGGGKGDHHIPHAVLQRFEFLAAYLVQGALHNFELVSKQVDGKGDGGKDEYVGALLHQGFYSEHVTRTTPVHERDTLRPRVHELRDDQGEAHQQVHSQEAAAHEDLVNVVGVGRTPILVDLCVGQELEAWVWCDQHAHLFYHHFLPPAGGDKGVKFCEEASVDLPLQVETITYINGCHQGQGRDRYVRIHQVLISRRDLKIKLDFIQNHGKRDTEYSQKKLAVFHQNNAVVVFVGNSHLRRYRLLLLIHLMIFLEHLHIDLEL